MIKWKRMRQHRLLLRLLPVSYTPGNGQSFCQRHDAAIRKQYHSKRKIQGIDRGYRTVEKTIMAANRKSKDRQPGCRFKKMECAP